MATHLSRFRAVAPAAVRGRQADRLFVAVRRIAVDLAGQAAVEGVLNDVSPFGCRLAVTGAFDAGEAVVLRIGGGMEVPAVVVWSGDGAMGCRFDRPMPRAALRPLMLRD